jgi:hypothetical protein
MADTTSVVGIYLGLRDVPRGVLVAMLTSFPRLSYSRLPAHRTMEANVVELRGPVNEYVARAVTVNFPM